MTDPDTNYATNAKIQSIVYRGETFPGTNTMEEADAINVKGYIDGVINEAMHWTSNYTGHSGYPIFEKVFIRLYKQYLKGEDPEITENEVYQIANVTGHIAIQCSDPEEDFEEPDPV
jgi:hypothetical protein